MGHNFTVKGGSGGGLYEIVWIGPNQIGGNLALKFGTSARNLLSAGFLSGATTTIGGGINYTSGNGPDQVMLDNTIVGKNATFNIGSGGDVVTPQLVNLGTTSTTPVEIAGALTIKGGADTDSIDIVRTRVGAALSIQTLGGDDTVKIDDMDVSGAASIDLGIARILFSSRHEPRMT